MKDYKEHKFSTYHILAQKIQWLKTYPEQVPCKHLTTQVNRLDILALGTISFLSTNSTHNLIPPS